MANKVEKLDNFSPAEILERGRELIRLAKRKEAELRQRQLIQIGEIFHKEILSGWTKPWHELSAELEVVMGVRIVCPRWPQQLNFSAKEETHYDSELPSN